MKISDLLCFFIIYAVCSKRCGTTKEKWAGCILSSVNEKRTMLKYFSMKCGSSFANSECKNIGIHICNIT